MKNVWRQYVPLFPLGVWGVWLVWILSWVTGFQEGRNVPFIQFVSDWDGGWYRSIVEHGYASGIVHGQENVAFFPLYPLIVTVVSFIIPSIWAGFLVSISCFAAALILLYRLCLARYDRSVARWAVLLTAFSPWSFYFAMMYSEALFLLLAVVTFYGLMHRRIWLAAISASLASATRPTGIVLGIIVVACWIAWQWANRRQPLLYAKAALIGLLSSAGLLCFMLFLWGNNHDPLAFVHVQRYWPGRTGGGIVGELTSLIQHLSPQAFRLQDAIVLMWYGAEIMGYVGAIFLLKARRYGEASFIGLSLLLGLITGSATSATRYLIVLFPLTIIGAQLLEQTRRVLRLAVLVLSGIIGVGMVYLLNRSDHPFLG